MLENDPAGRENLLDLVKEPKFAHLISPDAQSAAINGLMASPTKSHLAVINKKVTDAAILEKNRNFNKLPEETEREALVTLFLFKPPFGDTAVPDMEVPDLVSNPDFGETNTETAKSILGDPPR